MLYDARLPTRRRTTPSPPMWRPVVATHASSQLPFDDSQRRPQSGKKRLIHWPTGGATWWRSRPPRKANAATDSTGWIERAGIAPNPPCDGSESPAGAPSAPSELLCSAKGLASPAQRRDSTGAAIPTAGCALQKGERTQRGKTFRDTPQPRAPPLPSRPVAQMAAEAATLLPAILFQIFQPPACRTSGLRRTSAGSAWISEAEAGR